MPQRPNFSLTRLRWRNQWQPKRAHAVLLPRILQEESSRDSNANIWEILRRLWGHNQVLLRMDKNWGPISGSQDFNCNISGYVQRFYRCCFQKTGRVLKKDHNYRWARRVFHQNCIDGVFKHRFDYPPRFFHRNIFKPRRGNWGQRAKIWWFRIRMVRKYREANQCDPHCRFHLLTYFRPQIVGTVSQKKIHRSRQET